MKFLLVVPVVLYLAGCSFSLAPEQTARVGDDDVSLGDEPIADSALSEMGLESVLAPPGIVSPGGTANSPESTIFSNNSRTVNPLPPTSLPPANVGGAPVPASAPTTTSGFSPTIPNVTTPTVPSLGTAGPGSGAGGVAGAGTSF